MGRELWVSSLAMATWERGKLKPLVTRNPSWSAIERAIKSLDADDRSALVLEHGDARMNLGGGARHSVVDATLDDGVTLYKFRDPTQPDTEVPLVVGGQEDLHSQRLLADLDTIRMIARRFAEKGEIDPSVSWEAQRPN